MALPQQTTPDDIKKLVRFLQRKPAGVTKSEGERTLSKSAFDSRKIGALQQLGVIARDGEKIKLTPDCGRALARLSDDEFPAGMRDLIRKVPAYMSCVEWAFENHIDVVTVAEVGAQWHDHHPSELGTDNESEIARRATCFLQLCGGAGLGEFVEGRRGQPSRLSMNREAVEAFIYQSEFDPAAGDESEAEDSSRAEEGETASGESNGRKAATVVGQSDGKNPELGQAIFVGHGKSKAALGQLKVILDKFRIPYHVAQDEPHLGRPISEKVRETMKSCNCAILVFSADEEFRTVDGGTVWRPSENVVHELGAASYLYGKRIVILKEDTVKLPSNFSDLGYISFAKDELTAKSMDVLSELIGFGIVKVST